MNAIFKAPVEQRFKLRMLPLMVGLALLAMSNQESVARSNETTAAFTATQLVRQFTLKNTVAQVNQGMQGYVQEVNGQLRSEGMGPSPSNYPAGMGSVPGTVNLPQRDGAGRPLGYCAWDNTSSTSNASYLAGSGVPNPLVHAVISPGLNGAIETTCAEILLNGVGNNDDYVLTTAPTQASSRQFRSAVGTEAELFAMTGENGDVRLVSETNRLYSFLNGSWSAIGPESPFADDSAANGPGAISYTTGKVTVGDFQANSAVVAGVLTASSLTGNGAGLTDLNMSNVGSGVLSPAFGGTGVDSSAAANGQLLIGNGGGFALGSLAAGAGIGILNGPGSITISNTGVTSVAGTLDQVIVSASTGDITFSLPQAIATTSSPTFGGMTLNGVLNGATANFSGAISAERLLVGSSEGGVGTPNTIIGIGAMIRNQSGSGDNTAVGYWALRENTTGYRNSALGSEALQNNSTGFNNTGLGMEALLSNTTGSYNTAVGRSADVASGNLSYATAIGASSLVSTRDTLVLGRTTDTTVIGATGTATSGILLNKKLQVTGDVGISGNLAIGGTSTATGFSGNGSALTNLNAGAITSGVLGVAVGGTGLTIAPGDGQILIGNGTGYALGNISGTANQINVVNGAGSITLSLPQAIATTSTPTFGGLTLNGGVTGTTANFSGRLDVGSLFVAGDQIQAMTKTNIDAALTYASDTGDGAYNQPNLALGAGALSNSKRASNVAIGAGVLGALTTNPNGMMGSDNTGVGYRALPAASTGYRNTALGARAAHNLTTGYANTTIGRGAGYGITTGYENTVLGENALFTGIEAYQNIAIGKNALMSATSAYGNVAMGNNAMVGVTSGYENTGIGRSALNGTTSGFRNIGVGMESLRTNITGNYNLGIGYRADVTTENLVYAQAIGNMAQVSTSNTLVLGALGANKFGSTVNDQVVIGGNARNDSQANTMLFVNGGTTVAGGVHAQTGTITGRFQVASGLPNGVYFGDNTENLDTTSIYRFNFSTDQTHLRIRLGENDQGFGTSFTDEFQVGHQGGGWFPTFRVAGSGAVISSSTITATAFETSSDRRLKYGFQEQNADVFLGKLSALKTYSFNYINQEEVGRRIGVIAQEVLPLFPDAVVTRPDGFYAVDYGALGALAAAGVGRLNDRLNDLDRAFQDSGAPQTSARVDALESTVMDHSSRINGLEGWRVQASAQLEDTEQRVGQLESWKNKAVEQLDVLELTMETHAKEIAENALNISGNATKIENLELIAAQFAERLDTTDSGLAALRTRMDSAFLVSEDGSTLTVTPPNLVVSNFTSQLARVQSLHTQRLEAEMASIRALEVDNLLANHAVARTVRADEMNTGSALIYAGVGMPALLFTAKADGHYTLSTSALDGSYATAVVIVNAGQAKVVPSANEGIELFAQGNAVKAIAAGKLIKASWIKTG